MSHRLLIDHILICHAIAGYFLSFKYSNDPDYSKKAYESLMKRMVFHLDEMGENGVMFRVVEVIVDGRELIDFTMDGWKLIEFTSISTIFSVIGPRRMSRYNKAVREGVAAAKQQSRGAGIVDNLLQESKISCGEEGFPYTDLKSVYGNFVLSIINTVNGEIP
jgi:hypothetical protein